MQSLDSLSGIVVLRLICGFFFLPHALGKFTAREASFGFFRKAGFNPPQPFAYLAMIIEVILGVCLLLGVAVHTVAWLACIYLLIAAAAVIKVERKWLWHIGGCEFPVFWGLACAALAISY